MTPSAPRVGFDGFPGHNLASNPRGNQAEPRHRRRSAVPSFHSPAATLMSGVASPPQLSRAAYPPRRGGQPVLCSDIGPCPRGDTVVQCRCASAIKPRHIHASVKPPPMVRSSIVPHPCSDTAIRRCAPPQHSRATYPQRACRQALLRHPSNIGPYSRCDTAVGRCCATTVISSHCGAAPPQCSRTTSLRQPCRLTGLHHRR